MSGKKKERFKYLQRLNEAIHEKNITEAENCVGTLLTLTLSALGDSETAQNLKDFEDEKEKEKYEKFEEAQKLNTITKRNRKKTDAKLEYVLKMRDKLWKLLSEKELIPE